MTELDGRTVSVTASVKSTNKARLAEIGARAPESGVHLIQGSQGGQGNR